MKKKYFLESNWWLLTIFASKGPIRTLYFVVPITLFWIYRIYMVGMPNDALKGMALGVFIWSFIEYAIHRFVFHDLSETKFFNYTIGSFHLYHHQNPTDQRVYTSGLIPALFWSAFVISCAMLIGLNQSIISFVGLSLSICYFIYEWVHYFVHEKELSNPILKYLQDFHIDHHINPKSNFGQTSPFWDLLLMTYKNPNRKLVSKRLILFLKKTV